MFPVALIEQFQKSDKRYADIVDDRFNVSKETKKEYDRAFAKVKQLKDDTAAVANVFTNLLEPFFAYTQEEIRAEIDSIDEDTRLGIAYQCHMMNKTQIDYPFRMWGNKIYKEGRYGESVWGGTGRFNNFGIQKLQKKTWLNPLKPNEVIEHETPGLQYHIIESYKPIEYEEDDYMKQLRRNNKLSRISTAMIKRHLQPELDDLPKIDLVPHAEKELATFLMEVMNQLIQGGFDEGR